MTSLKNTFPSPERFGDLSVTDLLEAAALGRVGVDQRFLHAILDRGPAVIPELLSFAQADHRKDPVGLDMDLIAMFRHFRTPEAVPYYVNLLREGPEEVPDELTEAVVELGAAAIEPLLNLYRELDEDVGGEVAFVLASLGIRDPRILQVLLEQLEYSGSEGVFLLGVYGDPAARPALEALLAEIPENDKDFRFDVRSALAGLREDVSGAGLDPFDIRAEYPARLTPVVDALSLEDRLELLRNESAEYRAEAAAGFRNVVFSDEVRDRLLETAKSDPDTDVRARAWEALEDVEDETVTSAMRQTLLNSSAPLAERAGALVGLSSQNNDPEVRARMIEFYGLPETRGAAMKAMWRSLDHTFAGYFPPHLDDSDPEVRRQAIWGAGHLHIAAEAGRLQEMFGDEEFRPDALFNYALLAPVDLSPGRAKGLFRRIEDLAQGFAEEEIDLVETAIDQRLLMNGMKPAFHTAEEDEPEETIESAPVKEVGRNDLCPCGSGKKFKKCHGK